MIRIVCRGVLRYKYYRDYEGTVRLILVGVQAAYNNGTNPEARNAGLLFQKDLVVAFGKCMLDDIRQFDFRRTLTATLTNKFLNKSPNNFMLKAVLKSLRRTALNGHRSSGFAVHKDSWAS